MAAEKQYYDNADLWPEDRFQSEREQQRFAACAGLIPADAQTLLDVGTGNGAFLRYLEAQNSLLKLLGLERSETAIQMKVCRSEIQHGSADKLSFGDQSFDVVSALEVIEHLPFGVYERTLRELERVAGQYILISVPYYENRRKVDCPYCGCHFDPNYHMRCFDKTTLFHLFSDFQLAHQVEVGVPEYVVMPLVRALRTLFRWHVYPANAVCPQCGYTPASTPVSRPSSSKSSKFGLEQFIPQYKRRNWAVMLYQRTG